MNRIQKDAPVKAEKKIAQETRELDEETSRGQSQQLDKLNLAIHQFTEERKRRQRINGKILEVINSVAYLDEQFLKANRVLSAPAESYKRMTPRQKKAAQANLITVNEILKSITSKLNDIEQNLASIEYEDVDHVTGISRKIKTQIRSISPIIANLRLTLCIGDVDIDPAMTEAFDKAKETLFEQIYNLAAISEQRCRIVEAIQLRQEETMPNVAPNQDEPSN